MVGVRYPQFIIDQEKITALHCGGEKLGRSRCICVQDLLFMMVKQKYLSSYLCVCECMRVCGDTSICAHKKREIFENQIHFSYWKKCENTKTSKKIINMKNSMKTLL